LEKLIPSEFYRLYESKKKSALPPHKQWTWKYTKIIENLRSLKNNIYVFVIDTRYGGKTIANATWTDSDYESFSPNIAKWTQKKEKVECNFIATSWNPSFQIQIEVTYPNSTSYI